MNEELVNNTIINPTYAQVAKVFKLYYPNLFMCDVDKVNPWYIAPFRSKKPIQWEHMKGNQDLILFIDMYFTPLFEQKNVYDSISETCDIEVKKNSLNRVLCIGQLIDNLQDINFKERLCEELKWYYM
jgi:hypothetical protein